jgi:hypothetical protein
MGLRVRSPPPETPRIRVPQHAPRVEVQETDRLRCPLAATGRGLRSGWLCRPATRTQGEAREGA